MIYVTGIHALNLPCNLDTCGDWHFTAIQWKSLTYEESSKSVFLDYGIETSRSIPGRGGVYNVANHLRASLDLLSIGNFPIIQGLRGQLISNEKYTEELFSKVILLRHSEVWEDVDIFLGREYKLDWIKFKKGHDV